MKDKDPRIFRTLTLFAYGTISDFTANPEAYVPLQEHQLNKLRVLTLLSLADSQNKLSYADIAQAVGFEPLGGQVEELLIDAMNAQVVTSISSPMTVPIISGTMNQRMREFTILDSVARDVNPEHMGVMLERLEAWKR